MNREGVVRGLKNIAVSNFLPDSEEGKVLLEAIEMLEPYNEISPTVIPVSEKEAIKLLYAEWRMKAKEDDLDPRLLVAYKMVIEALEQEPKVAYWKTGEFYWMCSKCNTRLSRNRFLYYRPNYNYCPNCGARMTEPQESEG